LFPHVPPGSYRGSSREDSISSSFFGDNDSRAGDEPAVVISRHNVDDWRHRELAQAMGGLGISEDPSGNVDPKMMGQDLPLPHDLAPLGSSAPTSFENSTIRKQRSAELVGAKRRILETRKHESAESGDDEDEELGNVQVRQKSPRSRPKSSSKLGIEMMRTNSRGSVISVEDLSAHEHNLQSSPPPSIAEEREPNRTPDVVPPLALTPPEIFPMTPGGEMQDVEMEMPKPVGKQAAERDLDPTPRASVA
jgi:serine/threonine-protein kinase RIM15